MDFMLYLSSQPTFDLSYSFSFSALQNLALNHLASDNKGTTLHNDIPDGIFSISQPIVSILLAAGKGSRMGYPKALLEINKTLFIDKMLHTHYEVGIRHSLIVVQASLEEQIKHRVNLPQDMKIEWVYSQPQWSQLASLWQAITHLRQQEHTEEPALLIGPVDQGPYPSDLLRSLCQHRSKQRNKAYIPSFNGQTGHPVLIEPAFAAMLEREHPEGLRGFFHKNPHKLEILPLPYDCISRNLNTRAQYEAFTKNFSDASVDIKNKL